MAAGQGKLKMDNMDQGDSDGADTISLHDGLYDVALGTDLDGLTDSELEADKAKIPAQSITATEQNQQKLSSKIVVPTTTKRTITEMLKTPTDRPSDTSRKVSGNKNAVGKSARAKSGSTDKKSKPVPSARTLASMLTKACTVNEKEATRPETPKRIRSPGDEVLNQNQPAKKVKPPVPTPRRTVGEPPIRQSVVYTQSVVNTLDLKVCLVNRSPNSGLLNRVKQFIRLNIEESIEKRIFAPTLRDCQVGPDGVYTRCADHPSAVWLVDLMKLGIPEVDSELATIPHDEPAPMPKENDLLRVFITVRTKKSNEFILSALAQLNRNLDTSKWRIASRRYKGKNKMTLYMRIDKASFDKINNQNGMINGIAETITVKHDTYKPKTGYGKFTSDPEYGQSKSESGTIFRGSNGKGRAQKSTN